MVLYSKSPLELQLMVLANPAIGLGQSCNMDLANPAIGLGQLDKRSTAWMI
jgi:hypothetical protein